MVSGLLYAIVRALGSVLRLEIRNEQALDHCIVCGWHGRSLIFGNHFRNRGYWVVISHSNDGEIQNRIFQKLGYRTIRGSTGRGGARAAIEAIRVLRAGGTMAMTPDGPRGPSGVVQGGVMLMAARSGAALVPVGISARPRTLAKSWDRYLIPWPFAKGLMIFGEPIHLDADADEAAIEQKRLELERRMHELQKDADRCLGL